MLKIGDEILVIVDNKIRSGFVYDFSGSECRVADGELVPGKFTYSAWVDIESVVPVTEPCKLLENVRESFDCLLTESMSEVLAKKMEISSDEMIKAIKKVRELLGLKVEK